MASKRGLRRKMCEGKKKFSSEGEARSYVRRGRKTGLTGWLTVYKCKFCGSWHFGHPPKDVRKSISNKKAQWKKRSQY